MPALIIKIARSFRPALLCLGLLIAAANGLRGQGQSSPGQATQTQTPTIGTQVQPSPSTQAQTPQDQPDEVLRISTELVQTDVMVFDKQGRFVDNLKPEQFLLKVDGKPQPVSFFDRVASGSFNEEAQLAAARGAAPPSNTKEGAVKPLDRGRTLLFFLDDLHMAPDSLERARKGLLRLIDELGQNDLAAVTSASGRIGFLQQFTDNKAVLRAAVARLKYQSYSVHDAERPAMSEFQALAVERSDTDAVGYFVDQILKDNPLMGREMAENMVRTRARGILQQANVVTTSTLSSLESLMRSASRLPGRKVVFFMSDGFFIDNRNSTSLDRLRRITTQAARAGVVIYTIDSRGLVTGMPDASADVGFDTTGRLSRVNMGEITASQEALFNLAAETGGRAIVNTNAPDPQIQKVIKETSVYYLLAWRPDPAEQHGAKYRRLEVSVLDHPELTVRARRGFLNTESVTTGEEKDRGKEKARPALARTPDEELRATIGDIYPHSQIPTTLSLNFLDMPGKGILLALAMQVPTEALDYIPAGDKQTAQLDVAGIVLNDQGKQLAGFKEHLNVSAPLLSKAELQHHDIFYSYQTTLPPGLYQVRVAARDSKSAHTGSDIKWVEIPDLSTRRLAMSSLFVGERKKETAGGQSEVQTKTDAGAKPNAGGPLSQVEMSVDRRFARTSHLRFLTYIYNASRGPSGNIAPDVALQIQIFRDDQPVITNTLRKLSTDGLTDFTHIPYAAEVSLEGMPTGHYILQVTAIDRLVKASVSQRIDFIIE